MTFRLSRLAWLLAASTVLTAVAGVAATYWVADREFRDIADDDLKNQGKVLSALINDAYRNVSDEKLEALLIKTFKADGDDALWVTLYDQAGTRRAGNRVHDRPLDDNDNRSVRLRDDGHEWHGYQRREGAFIVRLLRRDDRFADAQNEILEDIATPMLVVSSINLLLLAALIVLTLWPLSRLVRLLERRSAYALEPLAMQAPAREIALVRDTLNKLMSGVHDLLDRERQFTNDVAHELRTPLTTLKLELASDSPDLSALKTEVDRLAKLVQQLLTLARVEQGQWAHGFEPVALATVCDAVAVELRPALSEAGMQLHTVLEPATVPGDRVLLEVLVRNLLVNVLRHCPAGTRVTLLVLQQGGVTTVQISDTGAGLKAAQRDRLNGGVKRLDSRGEGLGLGLAICRKIADVHGATLVFEARADGEPGLAVSLRFAS